MDPNDIQNPKCNFCYLDGTPMEERPVQTAIHLFGECDAFVENRVKYFGDPFPELPLKLPTNKILAFVRASKLEVLPMMTLEREAKLEAEAAERRRRANERKRQKSRSQSRAKKSQKTQ